MKKVGHRIFKISLVTAILTGSFILSVYLGIFGNLQTREELLVTKNATASLVLAKNGELIGKFFSENRTNISLYQIPPYLKDALIATEDVRFFEHKGVDSRSVLRVLLKSVLLNKRSSGGGSTITQQLAKNIFGRKKFGPLTIIINKTKETFLARRLEKAFTKEEILTLYFNTVSFGENVFGIEAASLRYFNKRVESLNIEESAVLIGMLKANTIFNPRLYPDNARNRRNVVLRQMEKYHYLTSVETDSLCSLPLRLKYSNLEAEKPAGYFLVQVRNETGHILQQIHSATGKLWSPEEDGLIITTTLDFTLQKYAQEAFHEHLPGMQNRLEQQYKTAAGKRQLKEITERELDRLNLTEQANDVRMQRIFQWEGSYRDSISVRDSLQHSLTLLHAGLFAMDPFTGEVKVWVGGIDFNSQPFDQILARRQLASTFKPILYAAALEDGISPSLYLDNDSIVLTEYNDWTPKNFDHSYGGKYSVSGALSKSMNVPTFNLFLKVGFDKLDSLWKRMGFSFPMNNTPSLPMGTAEANMRELAIAYSLFANGGYKVESRTIVSIKSADGEIIYQNDFIDTQERVISSETSLLMCAMLQKAITEGTGASMGGVFDVTIPLAGKTGTSQNYADAWFAAFNPKLVIVSRVGASLPAIHFNTGSNGTGSALALPLVALTLKKVQQEPELMEKINAPFPDLPYELQAALSYPDFVEKTIVDKFLALFKNYKIRYEKELEKAKKKKTPKRKSKRR